MTTSVLSPYRQSLLDAGDGLFSRCLTGTTILGTVFVVAVLLAPIREKKAAHVEQLPSRIAKLILDPPKPKALPTLPVPRAASDALPLGDAGPLGDSGPDGEIGRVGPASDPAPGPAGPGAPRPMRGDATSPIGPNAGSAGRQLANATVRAELAGTSQSLSSALDGLSSSLASGPAASGPAPTNGGRSARDRGVRAARSAAAIGAPSNVALAGGGGTADLGGSAIVGSRVSIGALSGGGGSAGGTGSRAGDGTGTGGGGGGGGAPGVYRSNASLLAVVQKYAAGIHYCYTNELKHDPALKGKLVFGITVAANGDVTEATVVENSLRSPRLTSCALSQVREWKFPPVPRGVTSFQVPFVFTPPQ